MEEGTLTPGAIFSLLVLVVCGWFLGQMFPWKRIRRLAGRVSGEGGIDYVLYDVNYTVTRDRSKRTEVELKGHFYEFADTEKVYVSVEALSPSRIAEELHRIHAAGAMICSLRPAEKRRKGKDNGDREPITVDPGEAEN